MANTPLPEGDGQGAGEVEFRRLATAGDDLRLRIGLADDGQPVVIIARETPAGIISDPIELNRDRLRVVRIALSDADEALARLASATSVN